MYFVTASFVADAGGGEWRDGGGNGREAWLVVPPFTRVDDVCTVTCTHVEIAIAIHATHGMVQAQAA